MPYLRYIYRYTDTTSMIWCTINKFFNKWKFKTLFWSEKHLYHVSYKIQIFFDSI